MEEKKLNMRDYVEETPDVVRKNCKKHSELTNPLVQEFLKKDYKSIWIVASGSSYNACMSARLFMRRTLNMEVKVIPPFTFENYENDFKEDDFVFVVSQSGRSTNALAALDFLKKKGHFRIGITGVTDAEIKNHSDLLIDWGVGVEKVGYVTKGVVTLAEFLMLFAIDSAVKKEIITECESEKLLKEIEDSMRVHENIQKNTHDFIEKHKKELLSMEAVYTIGCGANYGTALEAALKIGETVKIPAAAYESEEFLHGPCFPLNPRMTVLVFDNNDHTSDRMIQIYKACKSVTDRTYLIGSASTCDHNTVAAEKIDSLISPLAFLASAPLIAQYASGTLNTKGHPLQKEFGQIVSIKTPSTKTK